MADLRKTEAWLISASALALGGVLMMRHAATWPCLDDAITLWASVGAEGASDVLERSSLSAHLPTFFWLVRLSDQLGGEPGRAFVARAAPWAAAVVVQLLTASRLTRSRAAGATAAGLTAVLLHFVVAGLCLRPYAWCALLVSLAVLGLTLAHSGRPVRGALLATVAGGLVPHALLSAAPVGFVICAVVDAILWANGTGRRLVAGLIGVQIFAAWPVAAKIWTLFDAPAYHAWMAGAPTTPQFGYPALLALAGAAALFMHSSPTLRRLVWIVSGLALLNPSAILLYHWVSDQSLFAPRYHIPDAVFGGLLAGIAIGGFRSVAARVSGAALCVAVAAATSDHLLRSVASDLQRFGARTAQLRYAGERARATDLVVVSSPYAESEHWRYYEDELHRSYLLAEALDVPVLAPGALFPAPPGPTLPSSCWLTALERRLGPNARVWFVRRPHWGTLWKRDADATESAALRSLVGIGFAPVAGAVPPELASDLVLLERNTPQRRSRHTHGEACAP